MNDVFIAAIIFILSVSSFGNAMKDKDRDAKLEQLTERVQLLENALSDKSGINK